MPNDEPVTRAEVERLRNRLAVVEALQRENVQILMRVVAALDETVRRQAELATAGQEQERKWRLWRKR